jgi:DNA-binding protein YbaB
MFNKLKQFKDLRSQAKQMQDALATESVTVEKNGIKLVMNGNMEITTLTIKSDLIGESLEKTMKDVFNDAIKKTQRLMAQKMQQMGGLSGLGL